MSNLAVREQNTDVANYDPMMIQTLRNSLYPGAKEESVIMVVTYCHHAKLDVMLKPVHIVPMWIVDKETGKGEMRDVVMPGINLYRIQAARSGCAGISEPEFGEDVTECLGGVDVTYPKWCKVTVRRIVAGQIVEFSAKEYWKENYANAGKDKSTQKIKHEPNAMWSKRPYGQLAKCAEAQALRKGFPEIGSMPTAEEMEGKHLDSDEYDALKQKMPTNKGVNGLKAKLGMVKEPEPEFAEVEGMDFDGETGEVIEPKAEVIPPKAESSGMTTDTIKFLIESADSMKELNDAMKHLKELPPADKKEVYALYKQKESELK